MHNLKTNFDKILSISKSALKNELMGDGNFFRYKHPPKLSDIQTVALALTVESLGIDSENLLFPKPRSDYSIDFQHIPDRPKYNRRRRRLQDCISLVASALSEVTAPDCSLFIIDPIPLPIYANPRISRCKICLDDPSMPPSRGYHASHRTYYYGLKMQLVTSASGVPISLGLTPANIHDVKYSSGLDTNAIAGSKLVGDKGYLSKNQQMSLFENDRIQLITPKRANMKREEVLWNPRCRYIRKRIETLFSQMCDQFNLKRNYAKTLDGLFTRICTKIAGVATMQYINFMSNKKLNNLKHALAN